MKNLRVTTVEGDVHEFQAAYNRDISIDVEEGFLFLENHQNKIVAVFARNQWQSAIAVDEKDESNND